MPQNLHINTVRPDITFQVRYEPALRVNDVAPTISANVHDALWMLTQQWRVGEFNGEDAGTLVKAKIETQSTHINRYRGGNGPVEAFNPDVPLEAKVERLPLFLDLGMQLEIGLQWYKILRKRNVAASYSHFVGEFQIEVPTGTAETDLQVQSNRDSMQARKAARRRIMNGGAFLAYLNAGNNAHDVPGLNPADQAAIDNAQADFFVWLNNTYYLPQAASEKSWSKDQLEYKFSVSAPLTTANGAQQMVLDADKYTLGDLDWYSVDLNANVNTRLTETPANSISNNVIDPSVVVSYLPHHIEWKGMPKGRWWEFEDRNIDIAKMLAQKQDISKLILMEFGLIYSNDWFIIPHPVQNSTVTEVKGLVVTDVFDQQFVIQRAGTGADYSWQKWDMYQVNKKGQPAHQNSLNKLLMMPALINKVESAPIEKVLFLRDEMANMVWGVEDVVPNDLFGGVNGKDAAGDLMDFLEQTYAPVTTAGYEPNNAALRYKLQNAVPENWIPFIAAVNSNPSANYRSRQIQRARLLRYINDEYQQTPIQPRTNILRAGLDETVPQPYFLNQEEVSKSGFVVSTSFQRTRWYDGKTYVWLGRKKQTGRGEAGIKFQFDMLESKEPNT